MERILNSRGPAPTHDLVRLREPISLAADTPLPEWVEPALKRAPWVVVRRGRVHGGKLPVGVRGSTRSQRFPAWVMIADIAERRSPEELWDSFENRLISSRAYALAPASREEKPALRALARVAPILARLGYRWGPGGAVGFELATGIVTVTVLSDLDIILRQARRLEPDEARVLQATLVDAAAPTRLDAVLETPGGGVSLAELAGAPRHVLLRTPDGVRLATDPWADSDPWKEVSP